MPRIDATTNYRAIHNAYVSNQRGIVLPGGTRSTKTISALQWIILYCYSHTGKDIAICRDTMSNLRRTIIKDFEALCYGYGDYEHAMHPNLHINKSDYTCTINGNHIAFFGVKDDPMRVYGLKTDIFFINEAISTYKNTFDQLEQRCSEFWILDCNPSEPNSWVYELNQRPDVDTFRSTYKDNPFLPKSIINKIESYEPTKENIENGTADERKWSIYGKGLVHKGKEIIYPNWETYKDEPLGYDYCFYGLDWGFNHPLACTKSIIEGNNLYVKEVIYASEIEFKDVIEILKREPLLAKMETYIVCDSAEPRSIKTLQGAGLPAMAVRKNTIGGSVLDGIRKIQNMKIHIHEDSINIQREANNYKFKLDPKTDTVIDVPVKEFDDAWDSIRYPLITFL